MVRMNTARRVLVYGAAGHTGRFVVDELLRRGLTPVLAGRSAERLAAVPQRHAALERRVVGVDDPAALRRALDGVGAVINCAGPFLDTALPLARAAVAGGAHYLDVTAEQPAVQALYRELDAPARAGGRRRRPGDGLLRRPGRPARHRRARRRRRRGRGRRGDRPGPVVADRRHPGHGRPQHRDPPGDPRRDAGPAGRPRTDRHWRYPAPLGAQAVVELPFSEVITIDRHLDVGDLRSYLNTAPLDDLHDEATPPPSAIDEHGRSAQQFAVDVVVRRGAGPAASRQPAATSTP